MDESWLSSSSSDEYFLAVVSVITTDRRGLLLTVRRLRQIPKLKAKSELKASVSPPEIVKRFLHALADDPNISIVATVWKGKKRDVGNYEELYQEVVGQCALQTVRRNKRIDLVMDKRYTNRKSQQKLEGAIREAIAVVPGNIVRVFQEESHVVKELAAPDFVAWALTQRYGRADDQFYDIIHLKIAHLDDLSGKKRATLPRHR